MTPRFERAAAATAYQWDARPFTLVIRPTRGDPAIAMMRRLPIRVHDPDHLAVRSAVRAALVVPAVFAICELGLDNRQAAVMGAFGAIAFLVFADFTGRPGPRLRANLGLAAAGYALIPLGTLCSRNVVLATAMMAVVGFAVLFAGVLSGYVAAGGPAAVLMFVLPVMIPAGPSAVPERLIGWTLACAGAIAALALLWPGRPQGRIRAAQAQACRALAALLREWADVPAAQVRPTGASDTARAAIDAAEAAFAATPYRPTGPSGPTAALAQLVDDLDWLYPFALPPREGLPTGFDAERAHAHEAVAAALDAAAAALAGGAARPDLDALDATAQAAARAFHEWAASGDEDDAGRRLRELFRLRALTYGAWQLGRHALLATGRDAPAEQDPDAPATAPELAEAGAEVCAHASMKSVWLRNSLRGAVALAAAVLVGQLADAHNAYWIVLGTLAVLRSHALGTGSSVVQALAGTLAGILIGGAVVTVTGTDEVVLWLLLPPAVFAAAWAPKAVSFLAGQAAFSLLVLVLFNLLDPIGWRIGLLRVEDVAIGCAVSLVVGLLLWPRGAADVVRHALRASYDASTAYTATVVAILQGRVPPEESRRAHRAARDAHERLDTAFRQYLGERRALDRAGLEAWGTLVAGAVRIRRTGHALSRSNAMWGLDAVAEDAVLGGAGAGLRREMETLAGWFGAFARACEAGAAPRRPRRAIRTGRRMCSPGCTPRAATASARPPSVPWPGEGNTWRRCVATSPGWWRPAAAWPAVVRRARPVPGD